MARLSIALLGGFDVHLEGQPVTAFGADKVRALLAYIAVEAGRAHRRATLAALLWPELSEERAAHNLRQSLLRLRRALGEDERAPDSARQPFLLINGQDVQLNPLSNYRLDVTDFSELLRAARGHQHANADSCNLCTGWLQQAADLYHGDLLVGLTLRDSVPFEEWQLAQQEGLHGQALEVLERLADHYERRGEPARVLEYARRLVTLEPWQERAQVQVIVALEQLGQEAAALEQYANYSRLLSREFGLSPSAEARTLYERIRARRSGGHPTATGPVPSPAPTTTKSGVISAPVGVSEERRQVTALVCRRHAKSSTGSADPDPEELHEQMVRCREQCSPIIERFGGLRQPRQGADCLTYFGYPIALEDAARRAVSAALAISEAARNSDPIRIGIHTGIMIATATGIVGNVPDLARDAMGLADPGRVLVTADTERLLGAWFECEPARLAGSAGHALLYEVRRERVQQDHLDWLATAHRLTPLSGREDELQQLVKCVHEAQLGQGRLVSLCGEPGIGKSRLVWELKQRTPGQVRWIENRCSPYFQNTSLYPIIGHLEQLLRFEAGDDVLARSRKLADSLARNNLAQPAALWLMSVALGLPTDTPAPQTITEQQRERMREIALALIWAESAQQPLVLVIEDLHWADPTSLMWIERSLDALLGLKCVVLLTWRPSFAPPWLTRPKVCALELGPLSPSQSATMVMEIAGQSRLSDEVRELIVRQTDGVPLYVEALSQALLDAEAPAAPAASATQTGSRVPATLLDSLTARLDRTGPAKETAQWAAVLGRGFSHELLAAVVPFGESRLLTDLAVLQEAGLISPTIVSARPGYMFKHALLQDAAYAMLLKRTRQAYHRRIAEIMVASFPRIAVGQPEVVAHHYSQAGIPAQAAEQWLRAGEHALTQGATEEARRLFDHALEEAEADDRERRWRALAGREVALNLREEREAQRETIAAMLALAEACDDDRWRAEARMRETRYAARVDDFELFLRSSEAAVGAAVRLRDPALQLQAMSRQMQGLVRLDRWDEARTLVAEILTRLPVVSDEAVLSQVAGALALYHGDRGDISQALLLERQALEMGRRTGDGSQQALRVRNAGAHCAQLGLYAEARALHEEGLALAEAVGDRNSQTTNRHDLCYVDWCMGETERARGSGERLLAELRASGTSPLGLANCLATLGLILEDAGDLAHAASCLGEAHALFISHSIEGSWIEVEASEARVVLALGRREEAQRLALEVWAHLRIRGAIRIDFPSRVYLCLANVFGRVPTPGISEREPLQAGYRLLIERAAMIEDPEWRRSFLEEERSNRALLARWAEIQNAP